MAYSGRSSRRLVKARVRQRNGQGTPHPVRDWYASVNWSRVRFGLAGGLFLLLWAALWARAAYIQLFDNEFLAERARRQHTSVELVTGQRGMILDRDGQILARSIECRSVYVNPREVADKRHTADSLAGLLGLPTEKIDSLIQTERAFVWVARKIDDATATAIRRANLPGVGLVKEYERIYPFKQVAGQLLGFTDVDSVGLEGLERAFDHELSGLSARRVVRRDAAGRRFYVNGEAVSSGQDVRLTLDVQIQFLVEEALAEVVRQHEARWAGALVVDVESGGILAWAQYPFFNPNTYRLYAPTQYRNRLALDALEPGSTLKPLLIAAALQEGAVTRDTVFDCENGEWRTSRSVIRDDDRKLGSLSVRNILSLSSNIGCAKIGLKLGAPKYHQYLTRLGFGRRTGLHVSESKGIVHRLRDWSETDTMSISFGQGMAATVLQMTQAYLTLGNHGVYKPLQLVLSEGTDVQGGGQRIFSEGVSREVLDMMREVVEAGTGTRARLEGVSVAGKTGTAQKSDKSGTYGDQRTASFVGFVPADKPRYLVAIMIDEPQRTRYGGVIAAPVFKNVVSRTLAYHGALPETAVAVAGKAEKKETGKSPSKAGKGKGKPGPVPGADVLAPELDAGLGGERRYSVTHNAAMPPGDRAGAAVPDVVGKSVRRAVEMFVLRGIVPVVRGEGSTVIRQSPEPGANWPQQKTDQECILWISEK
ncbi:MAG: PASTA domain-containing protein [Deltaproteobacteria bacterium]|jgi:cell division protein FtsI (penicillin-binding protein 3)|nr:PASTA domain-containing protein [Deltaproteobacteria bacterium]